MDRKIGICKVCALQQIVREQVTEFSYGHSSGDEVVVVQDPPLSAYASRSANISVPSIACLVNQLGR